MNLWSLSGIAVGVAILSLGMGIGYWIWGRHLNSVRQRYGRAEAQRRTLAHRLDATASALTQVRARLVGVQAKYDKLVAELRAKDSSLADLTVDLRKTEAELRGRTTALDELRDSLSSIVVGRSTGDADLMTAVGEIRETLGSRTARVSEVEGELSELRVQVADTTRTADHLRARVAELEAELTEARSRVTVSEEVSVRLRGLEDQIRIRERRITELETDLAGLRANPPDHDALPARTTRVGTAPADHRDDLKKIHGIGPVLEKTLNDLGISTWEQIAAFTKDDIEHVAAALGTFPNRIVRDDWIGGARQLLPHRDADREESLREQTGEPGARHTV